MKFIPYNTYLKERARKNRSNPTLAEKTFWYGILKQPPFDKYRFFRQKPLLNFIADFYCPKLKLVIEIDGDTHAEQREYDEFRTEKLNKYGINIIRYTNCDVLGNIEAVYEDLTTRISIKDINQ